MILDNQTARVIRRWSARYAEETRIDRAYFQGQRTPGVIADYIAHHRFAWPGGSDLIGITDDGATLCSGCCKQERASIADSYPYDGWHLVAVDHTGHADSDIWCDHCGELIHDAGEVN